MFIRYSKELVERYKDNPIIAPADLRPTREDFEVIGTFNSAAFEYNGKVGLLIRVAERPIQEARWVSIPIIDPVSGDYQIKRFRKDNPTLDTSDPRIIRYKDTIYLTSVSHLRLAWSDDGINFTIDEKPTIWPKGEYESFGIEDPRVTKIGKKYYITYSAVSEHEVAGGLIETTDWKKFKRLGLILHPFNKDITIFPRRVKGYYWILHRPSGVLWNKNWMWISSSPDLVYLGKPICFLRTRKGKFDSARLGAGAQPILTDKGFLEIYHGATEHHRYSLGALLLDRNNPTKIIARSQAPLMQPTTKYEKQGFFGNVIFTDGVILRDDELWIYYGSADAFTCLGRVPLKKIWKHLRIT